VTATEIDDDTPVGPAVIRAAADAYVRDGTYATQNFGTTTDLIVKKSANVGNSRETYLRFDISSVSANATSVKLRLFGASSTATQAVAMSLIGSTDASWSETGISYNTRPTGGSPTVIVASKTISGTTGAWYEFDVTNYVKQLRALGITAVTFALNAIGTTDAQAVFNSDENSANRPELAVS
jgi:hypothetical protein